jgi:hypothetical protein
MTPRELVELAKALTEHDNVRVLNVTLTVESNDDIKDFSLHSNDDLFRPFHVNEELSFDDAEAVLEYVTQ